MEYTTAVRELAARIAVLEAYDAHRAGLPFDMAGSRRRHALRALEDELRTALRREHLAPHASALILTPPPPEPTREDLVDAFEREARRRLNRPDVNAEVLEALEGAAEELEIRTAVEPVLLELGPRARYAAGASRARR